jgi:hypothetical protein
VKALQLVGLDSDTNLFADPGPDEVELRYVSPRQRRFEEAIVLVEGSSYAYAAVAVPSANGWKRIAVFECWCKYEDSSFLDDFVRVEYTYHLDPELVLRASRGGTGLYEQTEARFALQHGEMKKVMSFTSRRRDCGVGTGKCFYEHRWFEGGQLVEAKASFDSALNIDWRFAEPQKLKLISCTAYKWDAASFSYIKSGGAHACEYTRPK